jgi:hypothetical protein
MKVASGLDDRVIEEMGTEADSLKDKIISSFEESQKQFEFYEKLYVGLSADAKAYVRRYSVQYKKHLIAIQQIILPSIKRACPTCQIQCCKLCVPEVSIYVTMPGAFEITDYLLVRSDTSLPHPDYENVEQNLCPYFRSGCVLPIDCRSFHCISWFCDRLKKELDMQLVSEHLKQAESVLNNFSMQKCMAISFGMSTKSRPTQNSNAS